MNSHNHNDLDKAQPETENLPSWSIIGFVIFVLGFCLIVIVVSYYGVLSSKTTVMKKYTTQANAMGAPEINRIHENENKIMNEYKLLPNGKIRVPIEQAMNLLVKESGSTLIATTEIATTENTLNDSLKKEASTDTLKIDKAASQKSEHH